MSVGSETIAAEFECDFVPASPAARSVNFGLSTAAQTSEALVKQLARRSAPAAAVSLMRPRQWIKNCLVIAAAVAAGALSREGVAPRVSMAFLAFCLLASGIYAINDVRDAPEDRAHPRKRFRPVAAGEMSPAAATVLGVALVVAGLALCAAARPLLTLVGAGYVALTLSYTLIWRKIVVLDVVAIGGGFVLRAVAGGVAAPVALSRWFLLVVSAAAVLVAAGKRLAESRRSTRSNEVKRRVLQSYPRWLLCSIIAASAGIAVFAYCIWAFKLTGAGGIPWRQLTIAPFAACLVRYGVMLTRGSGEAPEELLLTDRPLQLAGALWLVLFALSVSAASAT